MRHSFQLLTMRRDLSTRTKMSFVAAEIVESQCLLSGCRRSAGRLFHSFGRAAAKQLCKAIVRRISQNKS